jgi:hypothetical protein
MPIEGLRILGLAIGRGGMDMSSIGAPILPPMLRFAGMSHFLDFMAIILEVLRSTQLTNYQASVEAVVLINMAFSPARFTT